MDNLNNLINFVLPGSTDRIAAAPDAVPNDPWPGVEDTNGKMQTALDDLVTWQDGVTPPTGAVVRASIAAWQASIPTQAELDDLRREQQANDDLDMAVNKTVRDALWDMELRLRAAGQMSNDADIVAATTRAEYTTVLRDVVKGYLP